MTYLTVARSVLRLAMVCDTDSHIKIVKSLQVEVDRLAPNRFLIETVEDVIERIEGKKKPRKRKTYRVRVKDKEHNIVFSIIGKSLVKSLKNNSKATFYNSVAGTLPERYQAKIREARLDDRYEVISHISTSKSTYLCNTKNKEVTENNHKFLFRDKKREVEFECGWDTFRRFSKDPNYRFLPTDDSHVGVWQRRLEEEAPGAIEVLSTRRSLNRIIVTAKDNRTQKEFEYDAYALKAKLKLNPNYQVRVPMEVKGATVSSIADTTGYSKSHLYDLIRKLPEDSVEDLASRPKKGTYIEAEVRGILKGEDLIVDRVLEGTTYKPDLYIKDKNLVIECDGLYWHSEEKSKKFYHVKKKEAYNEIGVQSLFFREDEIVHKKDIVESIISNALGHNKKYFARKTLIRNTVPSFFTENHIMGKGAGRCYGLFVEDVCVAAIQVKWKSKKNKVLEVSRFCTKKRSSVIGGFSKLVKHAIREEEPKTIRTFIDMRYGRGLYLESLGWTFLRSNISFAWTDYKNTWHRMKFAGNTGYDKGLKKIWDCGQALWELKV